MSQKGAKKITKEIDKLIFCGRIKEYLSQISTS
jgi:hypothetical protein